MSIVLQKMLVALVFDVVMCRSVDRLTNASGTGDTTEVGNEMRIYQGIPEISIKVPYIACLRMITSSYEYYCTGTIIHESWVLTAAHCYKLANPVTAVTMVAGHYDFKAKSLVQSRTATQIIIHPKYSTTDDDVYDFLLLKVDPFTLNDRVKVVPLSNEPWPSKQMYKRVCIIAGWGNVREGTWSSYVRWHTVVAKHGPTGCKCLAKNANRNLICLDHTSKSRPCPEGDTGGPLVCDGKAVGVAHRGYMPEQCDHTVINKPPLDCKGSIETYMYICHELTWIASNVPGVPATPAYCCSSSISIALPLAIATALIQAINLI